MIELYDLFLYGEEGDHSQDGTITYENSGNIDVPTEGDWRIKKDGETDRLVERYENGMWRYHGKFGNSIEAADFIIKDYAHGLYHLTDTGGKVPHIRASLIDEGTMVGCNYKGISLVNNGRLESWRASQGEQLIPLQNDGTDILSTTYYEFDTTAQSFYQAISKYYFYVTNVPANTKMHFAIVDGDGKRVYQNVTYYDFTRGEGLDVVDGENMYTFIPCFNIAAGDVYTVQVTFSNTVDVYGVDGGTFSHKFKYNYYILTPSSLVVTDSKIFGTDVTLTNYDPTYVTIAEDTSPVLSAGKVYEIRVVCDNVPEIPSTYLNLDLYVNGTLVNDNDGLTAGFNEVRYLFSPSVEQQGISVKAALSGTVGKSIDLSNIIVLLQAL